MAAVKDKKCCHRATACYPAKGAPSGYCHSFGSLISKFFISYGQQVISQTMKGPMIGD